MADFVFVLQLTGFQHGDLPFTLKRNSITLVRNGHTQTFTFDTPFLLDHTDRAIQTYYLMTRSNHGIAVDEPGLPYDFHGDVIQTALKTAIFTSQQPLPPTGSCPYKGYTEHSDAGLPHPSRRRLCQRPHMGPYRLWLSTGP